jgi:hypothetical protein
MDVHAEITVKRDGATLFNHTYKFEKIYKGDGSIHQRNENKMLRELKKTRKNLEDTYNIGADETKLICEFSTIK